MFSLPTDAARLLTRLVDYIDHLRLFPTDRDACHALQRGLEQLAAAETLQPAPIAEFARAVANLLARECAEHCPGGQALIALKQCLDLLSWQVELSDPQLGRAMDCSEQAQLLSALAFSCRAGVASTAVA